MISSLLFPLFSLAALLNSQGPTHNFEGIALPAKADLEVQGRKIALEAAGEGLRFKKVVLIKARVYVGQLFVSDAAVFSREKEKALESLAPMKAVAMQMTFLRNVDANTVQEAFRESFKENKISMDEAPIQKFLAAVKAGGEATENKTLTIASEVVGGKEFVTYEGTNKNPITIEGPGGFRRQIFSLWLGKPTDSGVEHLQEGILKK
jgi:hypothetical protein